MKKIAVSLAIAGSLAGLAIGSGVAHAEAGDQDGAQYAKTLHTFHISATVADATKLGQRVCSSRSQGYTGDQIIATLQSGAGLNFAAAVNVVGYGEYHFCPGYFDMT